MAKKDKKSTTKKGEANLEDSFVDDLMQLLPEEDKQLLKDLGVKSIEEFNALLMLAGIDPAKAYKHASESSSLEEFLSKDIRLDLGGLKIEGDVAVNHMARVFFHKRDEVKQYHIRIKLLNAPVKIWRELKVPSNISLELLAAFLIEAMGWDNCHLHQFKKNDTFFVSEGDMEEYNDMFGGLEFSRNVDANNYSLDDVLKEKGDRMKFEYDFGDGWMHEMWVKGITDYEPGQEPKVELIKGHGACPPEDCGGVWGYEDLLALREKKRKSAEDKERLEWYDMDYKDYDPEFFDIEFEAGMVNDRWLMVKSFLSSPPKNNKGKKK
ncbi:MAG: plasmid pRiA4b ORF-3 family protein [Muribaculaceae bacterium]|nr:plasmid pRiA4b ORF-3 family protein [Muribaculaceae bacterium]